jgi:hypothetical protein
MALRAKVAAVLSVRRTGPAPRLAIALAVVLLAACAAPGSSPRQPTDSTLSGSGAVATSTVGPVSTSGLVEVPSEPLTLQSGSAAESVEAIPESDTTVEATADDGSTFRLVIPAFSLATPATISLRPLRAADVAGATFLAGVEVEPSGTELLLPATLTIMPVGTPDATNLIGLEYSGSGSTAIARLAAIAPATSAGEYSFLLTHFSGGVVSSLDSEGEALWLENKTFNTSTVAGRKAQAEHNIRVIEWSEKTGRISSESAKESVRFWQQEWWEAEADGIAQDPVLQQAIAEGNLDQFDVVAKAVAEMLKAEKELEDLGVPEIARAKLAQIDVGAYSRNAVDHLRTNSAFQDKLSSGQVSDMAGIQKTLDTLVGLARGAALAGDETTSDYVMTAVAEFVTKYVFAIADACRHTRIDIKLNLQLVRLAQFMGRTDLEQALRKCDPLHFLITAHYEAPLIDMTTHTVTGVSQLEDLTLEGEIPVGFVVDGARDDEFVFEGLATHTVDFLYPPGANVFNAACSEFGAERWTGTDAARIMVQSGDYAEVMLGPDPNRSPRTQCEVNSQLQPYGFTLLINKDGTLLTNVDVRAESITSDTNLTVTVETH